MNATYILILLFSSGYVKSVQNIGTYQTLKACQAAEQWVSDETRMAWKPDTLRTTCLKVKQ